MNLGTVVTGRILKTHVIRILQETCDGLGFTTITNATLLCEKDAGELNELRVMRQRRGSAPMWVDCEDCKARLKLWGLA